MIDFETLLLESYETPALGYPRVRLGRARILNHYWNAGDVYNGYGSRPPGDTVRYDFIEPVRRTRTTALKIGAQVWMVDDPPHWWTIQEHAEAYHGRVLCAGLGLGLIVHALAANPRVSEIVVVERESDVVSLIGPLVPECRIVCGDWNEFHEMDGKVDGVFYDLFVGNGVELLGSAMGVTWNLRHRFPGAIHRVLGFPNDFLAAGCDAFSQLKDVCGTLDHERSPGLPPPEPEDDR